MAGKVSEEASSWWGGASRKEVRHFTAKVFKSGNSLALRLPAGVGLQAGQEMELRAEDGTYFSFQSVDAPKRKFAIDKVWGSASGLDLIDRDERWFEHRRLIGDEHLRADGPES